MAAVDLDKLCSRLSNMQADQLYCLDGVGFHFIPKITGLSVPDAIATIRASLSAIPDTNERLDCICDIYTGLMANNAVGPCVLYHVGDAQCAGEDSLLRRFFRQIDSSRDLPESLLGSVERVLGCELVPETDSPSTGHDVYCFTFWKSSPCVALYRPPEGYSDGVRQVLGIILGGDPTEFERGEYLDLDAADQVALSLAPPSLEDVGER
ncbi:hypothetical protein MTO96_034219 [Rhipicephalus appendiculatus]